MLDRKKIKRLKDRAARIKLADADGTPSGIPCSFLKQGEFESVVPNWDGPKKCGNYHGSVWHEVQGFGVQKWVVGCHVLVDYDRYRDEGMTDEDILRGCIEFLNCPPKRKKYAKRTPKPLYGTLDELPLRYKFKEKAGQKCIMMILVTDQRKNKHFHGEGQNYVSQRKKRRRKKAD